jgi:hypothetical protein
VVATITGDGFERIADEELAARYVTLLEQVADGRGGASS